MQTNPFLFLGKPQNVDVLSERLQVPQPLGDWYQLIETNEQQNLNIDHRTAATRWPDPAIAPLPWNRCCVAGVSG